MAPSPPDAQDTEAVFLVVDDDPQVRVMLAYALRQHDLQAEEASSGEEALHILKQREADVVLLDVLMPGLDEWADACTTARVGFPWSCF